DAFFRMFAGRISDKIKKRKLLSVLGYGFSTIVKPFMYIATAWGGALAVRLGDRIGKGVRSSPRDALVADSVTKEQRGKAFGIHRAMDTAGAMVGLIAAVFIIYYLQGRDLKLELHTYRWLVLGGVIPAVIACIILIAFVREKKQAATTATAGTAATPKIRLKFDKKFYMFLFVMGIFTLGNSSDFFIILRAQNEGINVLNITIMLVLFNLCYAAVATPAGILSDKLGRKRVIAIGWVIYALVYFGFALSGAVWHLWLLFIVYGIYYGVTEGASKAFVADLVPAELRGTAYGYYQMVVGALLLPASVLAGFLWEAVSPATPFFLGAGLAFLAMVGMIFLVKEDRGKIISAKS
ncbi:MAG TPA: MFS transporter, partial [Dehalococcoidales bacterium]|nr:MFS transporter [Dehalococcoidales bacterium]